MPKQKKAKARKQRISKNSAILIILAIFILVLVNYLVFTGALTKQPRYRLGDTDAYLTGGEDPASAIRQLVQGSEHVILLMEGDEESTQTTGYLAEAITYLGRDFGPRLDPKQDIYGLVLEDGEPVGCVGAELGQCLSLEPGPGELLIRLKYPVFSENEVFVEGRVIEFRAKSGADALALVKAFESVFLGR